MPYFLSVNTSPSPPGLNGSVQLTGRASGLIGIVDMFGFENSQVCHTSTKGGKWFFKILECCKGVSNFRGLASSLIFSWLVNTQFWSRWLYLESRSLVFPLVLVLVLAIVAGQHNDSVIVIFAGHLQLVTTLVILSCLWSTCYELPRVIPVQISWAAWNYFLALCTHCWPNGYDTCQKIFH